jgi:hypothetical protein
LLKIKLMLEAMNERRLPDTPFADNQDIRLSPNALVGATQLVIAVNEELLVAES